MNKIMVNLAPIYQLSKENKYPSDPDDDAMEHGAIPSKERLSWKPLKF